jgi:hypothetical protein
MTEEKIFAILKEFHIDWEATPESMMVSEPISTPEQFEREQQLLRERVGVGYFCIDVQNQEAELALMRCTMPGHWETEIIPQRYSPLLPGALAEAVEGAGGTLKCSGRYPLNEWCKIKVQASNLGLAVGAGQVRYSARTG